MRTAGDRESSSFNAQQREALVSLLSYLNDAAKQLHPGHQPQPAAVSARLTLKDLLTIGTPSWGLTAEAGDCLPTPAILPHLHNLPPPRH